MAVASLVLAASVTTGCFATWDVPHRELPKLHGYRAPSTVPVRDTEGDEREFGPATSILVYDGERPKRVHLDTVVVTGNVFYGQVAKSPTAVVQIPLTAEGSVKMRRFSLGRTMIPCSIGAGLTVWVLVTLLRGGFGFH